MPYIEGEVRKSWGRQSFLGVLVGIVVLPPVVFTLMFENSAVLVFGAASWGIAVALKIPANRALTRSGVRLGEGFLSALQGLLSAVCELGVLALVVLALQVRLSIPNAMGLGMGAASVEALYLSIVAAIQGIKRIDPLKVNRWRQSAERSYVVRYLFFIERLVAALVHIGSRSLICLAMATEAFPYGVLATVVFGAVDGIAAYGKSSNWDWLNPMVSRTYYSFVGIAGAAQIALFFTAMHFK